MRGSRLRETARGYEETTKAQSGKRPQYINGIETTIVEMEENPDWTMNETGWARGNDFGPQLVAMDRSAKSKLNGMVVEYKQTISYRTKATVATGGE